MRPTSGRAGVVPSGSCSAPPAPRVVAVLALATAFVTPAAWAVPDLSRFVGVLPEPREGELPAYFDADDAAAADLRAGRYRRVVWAADVDPALRAEAFLRLGNPAAAVNAAAASSNARVMTVIGGRVGLRVGDLETAARLLDRRLRRRTGRRRGAAPPWAGRRGGGRPRRGGRRLRVVRGEWLPGPMAGRPGRRRVRRCRHAGCRRRLAGPVGDLDGRVPAQPRVARRPAVDVRPGLRRSRPRPRRSPRRRGGVPVRAKQLRRRRGGGAGGAVDQPAAPRRPDLVRAHPAEHLRLCRRGGGRPAAADRRPAGPGRHRTAGRLAAPPAPAEPCSALRGGDAPTGSPTTSTPSACSRRPTRCGWTRPRPPTRWPASRRSTPTTRPLT